MYINEFMYMYRMKTENINLESYFCNQLKNSEKYEVKGKEHKSMYTKTVSRSTSPRPLCTTNYVPSIAVINAEITVASRHIHYYECDVFVTCVPQPNNK